ncbi:MAG: ABC transporter permease [Kiritimatiellae bacterium]|nr:ABC transporter permease [Kiritimatiellia bacterium]
MKRAYIGAAGLFALAAALAVAPRWPASAVETADTESAAAAAMLEEMQALFPRDSRAVGTPGNAALAEAVHRRFAGSGFTNGVIRFPAPVFVPGKTTLTLPGRPPVVLEPLHPTLMRPGNFPQARLSLRLVYGGKGGFADMERLRGTALADTLLLMDFDCADRWLPLLRFGVRGFVFGGADGYDYDDSYTKVYNSEVGVPRFFVPRETADELKAACAETAGLAVEIESTPSRWENGELHDYWVLIPGVDPDLSEEVIVFVAPLDANAVVPQRAAGASRAVNLYLLLKMLDDFRARPPARSVMLAAVNAHAQRYLGERMLAWYLVTRFYRIEDMRDQIAREMRRANLYRENYERLKLEPVSLGVDELNSAIRLLWELDAGQQAERQAEYDGKESAREQKIKQLRKKIRKLKRKDGDARAAEKELAELETNPTPEIDNVLDLTGFAEGDYRRALAAAVRTVERERHTFVARVTKDSASVRGLDKDLRRLRYLEQAPFAALKATIDRAKSVFDDEKLLESWRAKLDMSTGDRLMIKEPLQNEVKRSLNMVKLDQMAVSTNKQLTEKERDRIQANLQVQRDNLTRVLVIFNKIDIGVGRSRTYYRQIAVDDTQRQLLKSFRDELVGKYTGWERRNREILDLDASNDGVRDVLGTKRVALVIDLAMNGSSDRIGFCSDNPHLGLGTWQRGFGQLSTKIAGELSGGEGAQNPFVDTMTGVGGRSEDFFFRSTDSAIPYFHAARGQHALSLKNVFAGDGLVFSPADTFANLDARRVYRLQTWLRDYFPTLLAHRDMTSWENLGWMRVRWHERPWSSVIRTFSLDEFSGKPIPDQPVAGCIVALYSEGKPPRVLPWLVDGDVVNGYSALTDDTAQALFYAVNEPGSMAPTAYKMAEDWRSVAFAMDKGRVQESKQINSNIRRSDSKTLPMFPCEEFPIYDRVDPTTISARPITVHAYWPKTGKGKANPQKYGTHGVASLSPADSHVSAGPAAIYLWKRSEKFEKESVLVLTDGKRCLLNSTPAEPEGVGFETGGQAGSDFFGQVAVDMDRLNRYRLSEMKGVANQLVDEFLEQGRQAIEAEDAARSAHDHNARIQANYRALGNEVKAYEHIRSMNTDMLKSIVVYMALMVPFCFFLEKLLFDISRLEHELLVFTALFVGMYVMFRLIHPAFRIAMSPEAIFIAFVLGAIGAFITSVLHTRFQDEMAMLFRKTSGIGEDVKVGTVGQTAMLIGVQNMKRRRVRTTLTTATIVLVIFTMLAFSSVSKKINPTIIRKSFDAPYTGVLYHWPGGKPMDEETARVLKTVFADRAEVAVRRLAAPKTPWRLARAGAAEKQALIEAVVGLPMNDFVFKEARPLTQGRFFSAPAAPEIILPAAAAEALGLTPEQVGNVKVELQGRDLLLVGLVDDQRYRLMRDLNPNLPLLPFKKDVGPARGEDAGSLEIDEEDVGALTVDTAAAVLLPDELARVLGAGPFTVSVRFREDEKAGVRKQLWQEATMLLNITFAKFYIGSLDPFVAGDDASQLTQAGIYYVGSNYKTSIGGLSRLVIPLIIAGSIILNTMLGTVYERKAEIAIFNAIGLNPTHIFMFFLAEAFVYSFIGSVGGYLIGQVLAMLIRAFNLVKGVNINFSSLMVVYAILFTIGLVMLSTIYPGLVATRAAVPSGKRKWSLPSHDGQTMRVVFPFIYQPHLAPGVMYYIYEYFSGQTEESLGDQVATFRDLSRGKDDADRPTFGLVYLLALTPFDLGVTQDVRFDTRYDDVTQSYRLHMTINRISGQDMDWVTTNRPFLEKMRKFLIRWRNIDPTQTKWYVQTGRQLFRRKRLDVMPEKPDLVYQEIEEAREEAAKTRIEPITTA